MKRMFFATAFSAALAVGAAAQTGTGTAATQTPQQDKQVTMTGCLQHATSGVSGTTGAPPAGASRSSSSAEFILSNATPAGAPSTGASTGTAGTAGAPSSSSMGSKYRLVGGNREDLDKYLNSKVEIRGTLETKSSSSAAGAGTGTGTGTGAGAAGTRSGQSDENLPILRVTSVRQVAATCAGGN